MRLQELITVSPDFENYGHILLLLYLALLYFLAFKAFLKYSGHFFTKLPIYFSTEK